MTHSSQRITAGKLYFFGQILRPDRLDAGAIFRLAYSVGHTAYMPLDQSATTASIVRLALASAGDEVAVRAAVELGNRARANFGHMPFAGYREAAANGTLLLAYAGEQVVGRSRV